MKIKLISIILAFLALQGQGQVINSRQLTEDLVNQILNCDTISKNLLKTPFNITDYEFEGNYSLERIFPVSKKTETTATDLTGRIVCVNVTKYKYPIWQVLKKYDILFDSTFYQNQIKTNKELWSTYKIQSVKKVRLVNWNWLFLYNEITYLSNPIFNKDGSIAIIKFGSLKGNSQQMKNSRIQFFKKNRNGWRLIDTIESTE